MGAIIGISGKIGSGKSTITNDIIKHMTGYNFVEKSFAYNIKLISSIISGLPFDDMVSQDGKNIVLPIYNNITVGQLQQKIGTELFRNHFDDMIWIKSLFASYNNDTDNWVVSDVRYKNEADYLRDMGGILIRLEGDPMGVRAASTRDHNHSSEIDLDDYDRFDVLMRTLPGEEGMRNVRELISHLHSVLYAREIGKECGMPLCKII